MKMQWTIWLMAYLKETGWVQHLKIIKGIGSFGNSGTILTKLMLDNDTTTYYTSGIGQKEGDWIGVDLRDIRDVTEISILQGRNSVEM